jgi:hypothetical protein
MPTHKQYEIVKQQCYAFMALGIDTYFDIQPRAQHAAPKIIIDNYYHLSDPDWEIVSKQLTKLYQTLKKRIEHENR